MEENLKQQAKHKSEQTDVKHKQKMSELKQPLKKNDETFTKEERIAKNQEILDDLCKTLDE